MKPILLVLCAITVLSACGGTAATPTAPAAAPTVQNATLAPATLPAASTRTDRRAPTLAPTAPPTETSNPTALPTETSVATSVPTLAPTTLPAATATRAVVTVPTQTLAPAVYVMAFSIDPPAPKSKPAQFLFHVAFLNTVGENVNYAHWRVLIFPKGQTKAVGDPQGQSKTIVPGASAQDTEAWSIRVTAGCETFTAQPIWENEDGKQTPLLQPGGQNLTLDFQVCP